MLNKWNPFLKETKKRSGFTNFHFPTQIFLIPPLTFISFTKKKKKTILLTSRRPLPPFPWSVSFSDSSPFDSLSLLQSPLLGFNSVWNWSDVVVFDLWLLKSSWWKRLEIVVSDQWCGRRFWRKHFRATRLSASWCWSP